MKISSSGHIPGDEHLKQKSEVRSGEKRDNPGQPGAAERKAGGDKIEMSGVVQQISRIAELVKATPDIRTNRVEAVKEAIDSGTYEIEGNKVAEKMLNTIREELPE